MNINHRQTYENNSTVLGVVELQEQSNSNCN